MNDKKVYWNNVIKRHYIKLNEEEGYMQIILLSNRRNLEYLHNLIKQNSNPALGWLANGNAETKHTGFKYAWGDFVTKSRLKQYGFQTEKSKSKLIKLLVNG